MAIMASDRSRSPRAPKHSLRQALEFAKKIYDGVHRSSIDSSVAFELMGFAGKSGSSATALGSVRQYGLIEGTGEKTRISELALTVFEPSDISEYNAALNEAAWKPEVFKSIYTRFDGRIPNADEPLRAYLIRELGFSKAGADETLAALRETLLMAKSTLSVAIEEAEPELPVHVSPQSESSSDDRVQKGVQASVESEVLRIPLTRECVAELRLTGTVSEKALANLVRHVQLMMEVWSE